MRAGSRVQQLREVVAEARSHPGGVVVVKLMGRDSGYITAHTALSARDIDLCLIPEVLLASAAAMPSVAAAMPSVLLQVPFKFEGPDSVLQHLSDRVRGPSSHSPSDWIVAQVRKKGHAVVLVAEGAGQELLQDEPEERDASGNVLKKDFCSLLNTKIKQHFADHKQPLTLKYIDPSYQATIHPPIVLCEVWRSCRSVLSLRMPRIHICVCCSDRGQCTPQWLASAGCRSGW